MITKDDAWQVPIALKLLDELREHVPMQEWAEALEDDDAAYSLLRWVLELPIPNRWLRVEVVLGGFTNSDDISEAMTWDEFVGTLAEVRKNSVH